MRVIEVERVRSVCADAVDRIARVMDRWMICKLLAWYVGMAPPVFDTLEVI